MEGKPTILVVDNEVAFRASLGETLLSQGYRMMSVGCCEDAREALSADVPDLVILGTISPAGTPSRCTAGSARRARSRRYPSS